MYLDEDTVQTRVFRHCSYRSGVETTKEEEEKSLPSQVSVTAGKGNRVLRSREIEDEKVRINIGNLGSERYG